MTSEAQNRLLHHVAERLREAEYPDEGICLHGPQIRTARALEDLGMMKKLGRGYGGGEIWTLTDTGRAEAPGQ